MERVINEHEHSTVINMTMEEAQEACKFGRGEEVCIYLTVGGDGFQCVRGTMLKFTIDERSETGTMTANGKGDWDGCAWR